MHVRLERLRVRGLEILELRGPGKRAHNVDVDAVLAPLVRGDARKTADALFGRSVAALPVIAEKPRARCEVDDRSLGLLEMRIRLLHIEEGRIETGVDGEVELLGRVLLDAHARGARLRVVDHGVDATELGDSLVDNVLHDGLVILSGRDICLNGQDLDAVLGLERLLGRLELSHVAPGNDEIGALLRERDIDAVADRTGAAVLERGLSTACDDNRLSLEKSHCDSLRYMPRNTYAPLGALRLP